MKPGAAVADIGCDHGKLAIFLALTGRATRVIAAEGIFIYVGMEPISGYLPAGVERDAAGFIKTDAEMCTSIPGVFAAGDIRSKRCRQVSSAVGDGATAATAASSYLEQWNA